MSTIDTKSNETIWKLYQFLGLNENPDGDTKLKLGEATVCKNWKVTRDRNLRRRPGFHTVTELGTGDTNREISGLWFGNVMGEEMCLAAANGHLWKIYGNGSYLEDPVDIGTLITDRPVNFFPFSNIVYIQNGYEYYSYDGAVFQPVAGYVPLVVVSSAPSGEGAQTLEEVNKLTGKRRVWFSPDGTGNVFYLPEKGLASIDAVTDTATGSAYTGAYSVNTTNGTVTFNSAPVRGVNTIEITYTFPTNYRNDVANMTNAELFLGSQDTAVFLYGDGTNKTIYSSVNYLGQPSAEYFPDLNVITVADDNTPITGLIRHNNRLMCYKTTSTYNITFGLITLVDGTQKYGFYVIPANKIIGNAPLGQVRLVLNAPFTLFGNDLYKWENSSPYSADITRDERMAIRISDRIYSTLETFVPEECYCYDDNDSQEYYIWYNGTALVYNYAADAWYTYTSPNNLRVCCMCNIRDDLIYGFEDGKIRILSSNYFNDDGVPFYSYWESGSIDYGKPYQRKFMANLWIGIKPQASSKVTVTIVTDRKSTYTERIVDNSMIDFWNINFADFSFKVDRKPQIKRLKIKAKKFAFMKFILKSDDADSTATVLMIDPKIRETGYVK